MMAAKFPVGAEAVGEFHYLGMSVQTIFDAHGFVDHVTIDQNHYIAKLQVVPVGASTSHVALNDEMHGLFRGLVGKLLWVSGQSRSDIAFEVNQLSLALCNPKGSDLAAANRVVEYLQRVQFPLIFRKLVGSPWLVVYSDASFGTGERCTSTQGFLLFLGGSVGMSVNLVSWASRKIKRVVRSTFAGELLAVCDGVDRAALCRTVCQEVCAVRNVPLTVRTDCMSLVDCVYQHKQVTEKRLLIDVMVLKGLVETGELESLVWVDSAHQHADALTKRMSANSLLRVLATGMI
jgi:hypothetical protein